MKRIISLIIITVGRFIQADEAFGQELTYVHYDTKDGLAGSTVYDMCQDTDGFIWFATEAGLSRFDGKNFKNYTVDDGLPDNEVLRLFADSRGRIWICTFKNALAYYLKGSLQSPTNNKMLRQIQPISSITDIVEDKNGNIGISDGIIAYEIRPDDSVHTILRTDKSFFRKGTRISLGINPYTKYFNIVFNDSLFSYENEKFVYTKIHHVIYDRKTIPFFTKENGEIIHIKIPDEYINYYSVGAYTKYINTFNGCYRVDSSKRKIAEHYLIGKKNSRTVEDHEGNTWFTTLGDGVYKLSSGTTKTFSFANEPLPTNKEVFSLSELNKKIVCGRSYSTIDIIPESLKLETVSFKSFLKSSKNQNLINRLFTAKQVAENLVLLGFDSYLVKLSNNKATVKQIFPIKSIATISDSIALIGTSGALIKMRIADMRTLDTIWKGRCTKVLYSEGSLYVGTLKGLLKISAEKEIINLGEEHDLLSGRITDISIDNQKRLLIATADHGVVIFKNNEVISSLTVKNGLSSNICKTLFIKENFLYIGTNEGLNKVSLFNINSPVTKYTISEGLPSNSINTIYVKDSLLWIGTPGGLTIINENEIFSKSICNIVLLSTQVSGQEKQLFSRKLNPSEKDIVFSYAGISFRSAGGVKYFYRLVGLDTTWTETTDTRISYQSLSSGKYKFEVYSVNNLGVMSKIISIPFEITSHIWGSLWLNLLILAFAVLLTWFIAFRIYKRSIRLKQEKSSIEMQFAALEQQALQAQMNPHFLFNCLNSIQQYMLTNEKGKANHYLTSFAELVRITFDISQKKAISLSNEIDYLRKYLEIEKMRFGSNFIYSITLEDSLQPDITDVPPLLLQPYVENSLRHGIRNKETGDGEVQITFSQSTEALLCEIKDNGVGRKKANEYKSKQHIEYQSKGMSMTAKRIELLNKTGWNNITIEVTDCEDEYKNPTGTIVSIKIPQ